jgi:hypothetical protein
MRALIFIASLLMLTSCYTKNQAIRKFCVPTPINIDSSWKINGEVIDSSYSSRFELVDSCDYLKNLYDSLINSGNFVNDSSNKQSDTTPKNNVPRAAKWAILYTDSVFTIKFRVTPNGKAQVDISKHERKIPYQAQATFKKELNQPCPPAKEPPWWHTYIIGLFLFLALWFAVSIALLSVTRR